MLTEYVVEDYFAEDNFKKNGIEYNEAVNYVNDQESDVIREQTVHLCGACNDFGDKVAKGRNAKNTSNFVRNFKILYIKGDDLLFQNPNLLYKFSEENDIMEKKANFIDEIAGLKPSNVLMILDEQGKKSYRAQKVVVNNEHADIKSPK